MSRPDERDQELEALRDRLSKLCEACLRINESLDLDAVLQGVIDSALPLTNASYAVITTIGESGRIEDFMASGLTTVETERLVNMSGGLEFFEYLSAISAPLRVADFTTHARSKGLPDFRPPVPVSSFLAAPIRHHGVGVGNIYVAKSDSGQEFSREDEDTLAMFASHVALVVSNARRHRDEQRARADLETLINTSPVGVVVFHLRTGGLVSVNREARRIVSDLLDPGQSPEQLLEFATIRRADGRELSLAEFPLAEALSSNETIRAEEIVMEVPNGRSVKMLVNATPILSDESRIESVVITLQDLTPLEELEHLRAELMGMVSHELRTPLTSIRGSATTMLEASSELDPAELRQFLRIIVDQADNMRDLISDLLDVARIETGTLPVSPEPAQVAALVDRARNIFLSGGGRRNLEIDLSPDLPLVMADRRRIVQVIGNLLSNAARHSPESSAIRVGAVRGGVHVSISVADEGRGIPADQLPHLFGKFSRAGLEDQRGDTGLGLAICKGIVEAHGGRIWAESAGLGLGARFTFTVPAVEESSIGHHVPTALPRRQERRGEPVLVVDDDPQTLRYVRRALSSAGYDPIVTGDPEEALLLMGENRPRLVLLDMMLPGYDGIEVMRDIFGIASVPVLFISAYGRDEVIARAFEMGASDYIVKPFSPTELVARVGAALRRRDDPYRSEPSAPYVLGDLTIDYAERLVSVAGRPVQLTPMEYGLLSELSINGGRVVSHDQLLRRLWTPEKPGDVRALRTHLRRLRLKLGDDASDPSFIFAEPRVGYRMGKSEGQKQEKA